MLRRPLTVLAGLLLTLGALFGGGVTQAVAVSGACVVTPDPDPVGTPYTVDATGLTVNTAFTVHIRQDGLPDSQYGLDLVVASDASGNASTGPVQWGPRGPQSPGTATVTWRKWQGTVGGGGGYGSYGPTEATCSWILVAA